MAHKLKIELRYSEPLIYRTVIVPERFTFEELHVVIQCVMNWDNSHMYQFNLGAPYASDSIAELDEEEDDFGFGDRYNKYDASSTFLADYFNDQKKQINYIYDFGDDWIHVVKVQKKPKDDVLLPICIKGENAAPVDDCGGIYGFYELLETLNRDGNSKEKKELVEWLGISGKKTYDDEFGFYIDEVNTNLRANFTENSSI